MCFVLHLKAWRLMHVWFQQGVWYMIHTHWILVHGTQWCICVCVRDPHRSMRPQISWDGMQKHETHTHIFLFQVPEIFCDHCSFKHSSRCLSKACSTFSSIKAITKERQSFILQCHATLQASVFHLVWNENGKQEAKPHWVIWPNRPSVIGWQSNGRRSRPDPALAMKTDSSLNSKQWNNHLQSKCRLMTEY